MPNIAHLAPAGNSGAHYLLASRTTVMGNRTHAVTTCNRALALAVYEQALDVDIEPDMANDNGSFTIEFICNDSECHNALSLANQKAGGLS